MSYSIKSFKAENAREAYSILTNELRNNGKFIMSRNEPTLELLNVSVEINNPRDRIIPIKNFKKPFILQEAYDILNSNDPRVIHSKQMLEKTMGDSSDPMFFGNELRQAFSRWSLRKLLERFIKDKYTRKAVLTLGNRRNTKHTPCMIYSHFIIRDNKLYMTSETRGTAISMGFTNDIYFLTLMQEIMLGWIKEYYPEVKMGTFLYKTVSMHTYIENMPEIKEDNLMSFQATPLWDQSFVETNTKEYPFSLTYNEYIKEMGVLYHYVDMYMKATEVDDIDNGDYINYGDLHKPDESLFKSKFFYNWALELFTNITLNNKNIK